jgi:hypothetical protein
MTSNVSIITELEEYQTKIITLDEAGFVFKDMKKSQSHLSSLPGLFNKLYTMTNQPLKKNYSKANKDNNMFIINPHLSIIGAATPKSFWDNVDYDDVETGFIPRLIILTINKKVKPQELINYDINKLRQNIYVEMEKYPYGQDKIIPKIEKAKKRVEEWREYTENVYEPETIGYSICSRATEMVHKFALIHCVSLKKDKVDLADVDWAIQFVGDLSDSKIRKANKRIARSLHEKNVDEVVKGIKRFMRKRKKNSINKNDLARFCMRKFNGRERSDIIKTMVEDKDIIEKKVKTKGRSRMEYQLADFEKNATK